MACTGLHAFKLVLNQGFVDELESAPAAAKPALTALARLYGLTRLERDLGTFLAAGALAPRQAPDLRAEVNALCGALMAGDGRPALALCASFGIPDHCLAAPIAFDWRAIGEEITL